MRFYKISLAIILNLLLTTYAHAAPIYSNKDEFNCFTAFVNSQPINSNNDLKIKTNLFNFIKLNKKNGKELSLILSEYNKAHPEYFQTINNKQKSYIGNIIDKYKRTRTQYYRRTSLEEINQHVLNIQDMTKKLENSPSDYYYFSRGYSYYVLKQYRKSLEDYNKISNYSQISSYYYFRSKTSLELNNIEDAIIDISKAIELSPHHSFYYLRAICYYAKNMFPDAIKDCTSAISLDNESPLYYDLRSKIYDSLNMYIESGYDLLKSLELTSKEFNTKYKPETLEEKYLKFANYFNKEGTYKESAVNYSKLIAINPNNTNYYLSRAGIYQKLGLYEKAISDYTKVIDKEPQNSKGYINRLLLFYDLKNYNRALYDANALINLNAKSISHYLTRIDIYKKLHEFEKAKSDYDTILELNPYDPDMLLESSLLCYYMGKYKEGIYNLKKALNQSTSIEDSAMYCTLISSMYFALQDYATAKEWSNKSINLVGSDKGTYFLLAFIEAFQNNNSNALVNINKSIILAKNDRPDKYLSLDSLYLARSSIYQAINNYKASLKDINKAIKVNPNNAIYYSERAHLYSIKRKKTLALKDIDKALSIDNMHPLIYSSLGKIYSHFGDFVKAEKSYDKAIQLAIKQLNRDMFANKLTIGQATYSKGLIMMAMHNEKAAKLNFYQYGKGIYLEEAINNSIDNALDYYKRYNDNIKNAKSQNEKIKLKIEKEKFEKEFYKTAPKNFNLPLHSLIMQKNN